MAKSITLKDVAQRVGITSAAASMALSGHERISERTRAAVKQAADELGYVPSSAGRALRNQKAGAVALIVPNSSQHVFGHMYFMHVLTGVSTAANAHDAQVIVSTNADEPGSTGSTGTPAGTGRSAGALAYERVMRSRSADGAIVTSAAVDDRNIEALVASGLPVVLIGNFPYLADAVSVGIDDVTATERITEHLVTVHRRRDLVHVTGTLDHQTGIDRRDGFLRAVDRLGVQGTLIEGDLSEESGVRSARSLIRRAGPTPDGIVFANDDMALGGMRTLAAAGIRVPEDISIVGFDDFGLARVTTPGITTIRVPAEEMARTATERLFAMTDGAPDAARSSGPTHTELPVELVIRESCGCPATP